MILIFLALLIFIIAGSVTGGGEKIEIREHSNENLGPYLKELSEYENTIEDKNNFCFVIIYYNDHLAGFVKKYNCNIGSLFIIPKYRNLGLGSKLIKYVLNPDNKVGKDYKNTICKEIYVGVLKSNPEYEKLKKWYVRLGLNKLLFENYRGIGLFYSNEKNKLSIDEIYDLTTDISLLVSSGGSEEVIQKKIEKLILHFIGKVKFYHYLSKTPRIPYSVLDEHSSFGERLIRFLADPLCESYIGKNSHNSKLVNKTLLYTFTNAFKRPHEKFLLLEPYEEYPIYYAGSKDPSLLI